MKKRILLTVIALGALCALLIPTVSSLLTPRTLVATPTLTFRGTTAVCSLYCVGGEERDELEASLTLWHGENEIMTWHNAGEGKVEMRERWYVEAGERCTLELKLSVNGGEPVSTTVSGTCRPAEEMGYLDEPYQYPVTQNDPEWAELTTLDAQIAACHVEVAQLEELTTPALLETVMNYPLIGNVIDYDPEYPNLGIFVVSEYFGGLDVLFSRDDLWERLMDYREGLTEGTEEYSLWTVLMERCEEDMIDDYKRNTEKSTRILEGPFSVELDLADLESNLGTVVYEDGRCKVFLSQLYPLRNERDPYSVHFRAGYDVSPSGIRQITAPANTSGYLPVVTVNGEEKNIRLAGYNGDLRAFGYYLPVGTQPTDQVVLTFPYLIENSWDDIHVDESETRPQDGHEDFVAKLDGSSMSKEFRISDRYPYAEIEINNQNAGHLIYTITKDTPTGEVVEGGRVESNSKLLLCSDDWVPGLYFLNLTSGQYGLVGDVSCNVFSSEPDAD